VRVLLETGAHADARNSSGDSPLHVAAKFDQVQIVELLLQFGVDVSAKNAYDETPLMLARKHGDKCESAVLLDSCEHETLVKGAGPRQKP
jgi:ankyrin repeat protein